MSPTGGARRRIGFAEIGNTLSWSPDSRFVIAGGTTAMTVADAVTGLSVRLPKRGFYPAWEPAR
jgi:hypothetical protein